MLEKLERCIAPLMAVEMRDHAQMARLARASQRNWRRVIRDLERAARPAAQVDLVTVHSEAEHRWCVANDIPHIYEPQ